MKPSPNSASSRIASIISGRSAAEGSKLVKGWQNLLQQLLDQMSPYLRPGHLVTFRTLTDAEKHFFEDLHRKLSVPPSVGAIFMPPSARSQMMSRRPEGAPLPEADSSVETPPPDEGILLASRTASYSVIVNALFAKPPFAPAIDVYDDGRLLAGYVYNTIDECTAAISKVLQIHLQPLTQKK